MKQTHTLNIIYDGPAADLIDKLKTLPNCQVEFIPPGLVNSASVLIITEDVCADEQQIQTT